MSKEFMDSTQHDLGPSNIISQEDVVRLVNETDSMRAAIVSLMNSQKGSMSPLQEFDIHRLGHDRPTTTGESQETVARKLMAALSTYYEKMGEIFQHENMKVPNMEDSADLHDPAVFQALKIMLGITHNFTVRSLEGDEKKYEVFLDGKPFNSVQDPSMEVQDEALILRSAINPEPIFYSGRKKPVLADSIKAGLRMATRR